MDKISVIMPIYNTKPTHLKAAIESILTQSYTNFEFLILNDSPENKDIKNIVKSYNDPRVKYMENKKNLGIAQSYNHLLESANAPYIAMMNHDDIAQKTRLEKELTYLSDCPQTGLIGTAYKKFGEIKRIKTIYPPTHEDEIRALLLFKSPIHHPTIMFRRDIIVAHNIRYNEKYISLNDRQFYYEMSKKTKLANLNEVLYKYRFHKEMTSKIHKSAIKNEQRPFHELWFKDNNLTLSKEEMEIFNEYATNGRCKIKNFNTIKNIHAILEYLVKENETKHFAPQKEFANICAKYLEKRCLNAAFYGFLSTKELLNTTPLPVHPPLILNLANAALNWRN